MRVARVAGLPFLRVRRNHSRKTKLEKLAFRPDAARFPKQMSPKGPNSSSPWRIKFRKGRAFPYKEAEPHACVGGQLKRMTHYPDNPQHQGRARVMRMIYYNDAHVPFQDTISGTMIFPFLTAKCFAHPK
jgi:hypothetical protein